MGQCIVGMVSNSSVKVIYTALQLQDFTMVFLCE